MLTRPYNILYLSTVFEKVIIHAYKYNLFPILRLYNIVSQE